MENRIVLNDCYKELLKMGYSFIAQSGEEAYFLPLAFTKENGEDDYKVINVFQDRAILDRFIEYYGKENCNTENKEGI